MQIPDSARLVRLSDTNLSLEHAAEDVRGCKVMDAGEEHIGHVDDLMIDDTQKKVRFIVVAAGGFLGIGEKRFWIPVDAVTSIAEEIVHVDTTVDHVKQAPGYDPEIVPSPPYVQDVYEYYGVTPYWGVGYIYPPFPYMAGGPGNVI